MSTPIEPRVHVVPDAPRGVLAWRFSQTVEAISSATHGGGTGLIDWILNIGVDSGYSRTDLDEHASEVAATLSLGGQGTALFTAVDVRGFRRAECDGVVVHATVGVSKPTWAAASEDHVPASGPGTINVVAQLPVGFEPGAAVNAAMTITEAKVQALAEAGVAGTGTATDAAVVSWPAAAPRERFAGPRSLWGQRLALAVRSAVRAGLPQ